MAKGLEYFIVTAAVLLVITLVVTFSLSYVVNEHVTYLLPYLSDTGTLPPESCYFGQCLTMLWVLSSFIMYLKYGQIKYMISKKAVASIDGLNKYALTVGLFCSFGLTIVANFQETNVIVIHWIGATMIFGFGAVYMCIMTAIYISVSMYFDRRLILIRFILSIIGVVSFLIFFIAGMVAYSQFNGKNFLHWTSDYAGYKAHQSSTISEWVCAGSIFIYLAMYYWEFKQMSLLEPVISYNIPELHANVANRMSLEL